MSTQRHGDPNELMYRLIDAAAAKDVAKLGGLLEQIGCPQDSPRGRVMIQLVYTAATWVGHDGDDDRPVGCTCAVPAIPETVAMLLVLAQPAFGDNRDWDAANTKHVLTNICQACTVGALLASSRAHARTLDETNPGWREEMENELQARLDEENSVAWSVEPVLRALDW